MCGARCCRLAAAAAAAAVAAAAVAAAPLFADEPASLVPVTPLTPLQPHIPLGVTVCEGGSTLAAASRSNSNSISLGIHGDSKRAPVSGGGPSGGALGGCGTSGSTDADSRALVFKGGEIAAAAVVGGSSVVPAAAAAGVTTSSGGGGGQSGDAAPPAPSSDAATRASGGGGGGAPAHVVLTGVVMGKGSFGRVVEGVYCGRRVAVKQIYTGILMQQGTQQLRQQLLTQQQSQQAQQAQQAQEAREAQQQHLQDVQDSLIAALEQEVQVLARVQHENIVTLLAANLEPPNVCLVMERMDTSLDHLLYKDPNRPFPLSLAVHIALQVARALAYLHPTILHRDLKPGNVLISNADDTAAAADPHNHQHVVVKLADFGLSRLLETVLVTQEPEVGTAPYMAPECFDLQNIVITDRADCYSFGVLLWELVARRQPWSKQNMMQVAVAVAVNNDRLPLLPLVEAGAPPKLQRLVTQCFDADPQRRPAAAELVKELLLVQQQLASGSTA